MYAVQGYFVLCGKKYCLICACQEGEQHPAACTDMTCKVMDIVNMQLYIPPEPPLLFMGDTKHLLNQGLELDGTSILQLDPDFTVLGDNANMVHLYNTIDTHQCFTCTLSLKDFVQGDTFLGEHIYHVYNNGIELLDKHRSTYEAMITQLPEVDEQLIIRLASFLFDDGIVNWGRIVSFIAFAAVASQMSHLCKEDWYVTGIGRAVANYLTERHLDWLVANGSWVREGVCVTVSVIILLHKVT
uniref:Bcl-2 Bcl-2 homology region 1-3 domain-containing protein n=1 Tax=Amphilophus citrinellus TaxID=61819 RepID=A0A3Q0T8Z8_AMPCI